MSPRVGCGVGTSPRGWANRTASFGGLALAACVAGSLADVGAAGGVPVTGRHANGISAAGTPAANAQAAATVGEQLSPTLIRERTEREWDVKAEKMRRHLLPLMRAHEIDLWVIMSRENAPDPALELFGGYGITGWYGHRNAYLFHDAGADGLRTTVLGTHLSGQLARFYDTRELYGEEGLAPHLRRYVEERDPRRIAINQSRTISMADGLTAELKEYLLDALAPRYQDRLVSSEPLLVEYVSTRTPAEDAIQREASAATFAILRRALSNEVIAPGRTTLLDVHYWITAEWKRQGFEFNFPASVDLQRAGAEPRDSDDAVISHSPETCCTSTSGCAVPASWPTSRRWPTCCGRARRSRRPACAPPSSARTGWPRSSSKNSCPAAPASPSRPGPRRAPPTRGSTRSSTRTPRATGCTTPGSGWSSIGRTATASTRGFRCARGSGSRWSTPSPRRLRNGTGRR